MCNSDNSKHHCGHCHEHNHADGTTHTHSHSHEGGETHNHPHSHMIPASSEEALALLKYMLDHNKHHADELHDLAHSFDEVEGDLLHDAVEKLGESNSLIEQALSLIENK